MSLRAFLEKDPLATAETELKRRSALERFGQHLGADRRDVWPLVLERFVRESPWRYWDPSQVDTCLEILETSPERTFDALSLWSAKLGLGFGNLFHKSPTVGHEEGLTDMRARDLVRLATEFHPEYLRCAEHVFSNLLVPYWAVLRKGGVQAKYTPPGAIQLIQERGYAALLSGYDDRVRNAIAHGEVVFRADSIRYGLEVAHHELASFEFLELFDTLYRTSNALAVGMLLFLARHPRGLTDGVPTLPGSIVTLLASAAVQRNGFAVLGAAESESPLVGRQLHIAVKTVFRSREVVLLDCARLALHLVDAGARPYARYLFDVD